MTYEVEVEVIYVYHVEADTEQDAAMLAQMNVVSHQPHLDCFIASVKAEEIEPGNVPARSVQSEPSPFYKDLFKPPNK